MNFFQFAVDATKNALLEVESRDRPKRDADPLTEDDIQQVSISSTFYAFFFCSKVFFGSFF